MPSMPHASWDFQGQASIPSRLWEWLPEGAVNHDPQAYLKSVQEHGTCAENEPVTSDIMAAESDAR